MGNEEYAIIPQANSSFLVLHFFVLHLIKVFLNLLNHHAQTEDYYVVTG